MFLIGNLLWTSSALGIYWGGPWKIKLYEHIPLIVLSAINIIVGTVFFFITDSLTSAFGFGSISVETGAVVYGIVVGGIVVQLIFNSIIYKLDLYKTTL